MVGMAKNSGLYAKQKAEKEKLPTGIKYDENSKTYYFRLSVLDSTGKKRDATHTGFPSVAAAKKAREELRYELKHKEVVEEEPQKNYDKTFNDVYEFYLQGKAQDKALGTIKKQNSLWEHHIQPIFGDRKLSEVSKGEIENYLATLYREGDTFTNYKRNSKNEIKGYAYAYVEGFVKLFWLIYGIAYDHGWVENTRYQADFVNQSTKIKMPKEATEEEPTQDDGNDDEIEIYTQNEIQQILKVVEGGNLQLPTEIALYCGLRRSEIFGLMIKDIDLTQKVIRVRRQLLYDSNDRVFYIGPTKTEKSVRTVNMPNILVEHLHTYLNKVAEWEKVLGYRNTEIVYNRFGKPPKGANTPMQGAPFLFRTELGELMTVNSIKYWAKKCKEEAGITLKFHKFRHTNASYLASHGVPLKTLMNHLGHARERTAMKYYITTDEQAKNILLEGLNNLPKYVILSPTTAE